MGLPGSALGGSFSGRGPGPGRPIRWPGRTGTGRPGAPGRAGKRDAGAPAVAGELGLATPARAPADAAGRAPETMGTPGRNGVFAVGCVGVVPGLAIAGGRGAVLAVGAAGAPGLAAAPGAAGFAAAGAPTPG